VSAVVLVQARMASARLPGKVLADLCGRPLLEWLLERLRSAPFELCVTTTRRVEDDAIVAVCEQSGVRVFRGPTEDVLLRMVEAARAAAATEVVRVSADSPFVDGRTVEAVAAARGSADIAQNHLDGEWPQGTAVEALSFDCLARLDAGARTREDREHVTLYAYEHRDTFDIASVSPPLNLAAPDVRLLVDTADDLARVRTVCRELGGDLSAPLAEVVRAARLVTE
jgi:spore coat polysaccharide biosynthesis protein SpsF